MATDSEAAIKRYIDTAAEKAMLLHTSGHTDHAITMLTDLLPLTSHKDDLSFKLAGLYISIDHVDEALCALKSISELSPLYPESLFLAGIHFANRRMFAQAAECFKSLVNINDDNLDAHNNLGLCLFELQQPKEALFHLNRTIELNPERAESYSNLGNLLVNYWKLSEASVLYRRAITKKEKNFEAYCNLGRIANFEGRIDDAIALSLQALTIQPDFRIAADNILFSLINSDTHTPDQISSEHFRLARIYPASETGPVLKINKNGKIRVGYVSPDFKSHSVGFFIEPVLQNHNRNDFDIFCYDQTLMPDETTERIKSFGWTWRSIYGLSDQKVADMVIADKIDILVDLAGHTKDNRLGVFALKPAPIQATWLGYPHTTGLKQVDYRLTDEWTDPTGNSEQFYSEKLVRLPNTFLCYAPSLAVPETAALPDVPITFCCFNHNPKISNTIISLWTRILHAVPGSRLFLKNGPLGDSGVRTRVINQFSSFNIDSSRLILSGFKVSREEHLNSYGICHIALDTYPYNGTTTTCEALWMGVPVVTLTGTSHASRVGMSILHNSGLPELVATHYDQYVDIAVSLAQQSEKLENYRATLRATLLNSALTDAVTFTNNLEQTYRTMLQ